MTPEIVNLVETGVYVDDLEQAERFYADVLGLSLIGRESGRHVFFRVGREDVLLLFRAEETIKGDHLPAHGRDRPWTISPSASRPGLSTPGGGSCCIRGGRRGGQGRMAEQGGRSLYFRDPAGNSVELITPGVWGLPTGW